MAVAGLLGASLPAAASTGEAARTPLADSADAAMGWTGRRSMADHVAAVRSHLDRAPTGTWDARDAPSVEPFPALDPAAYFTAEPAPGLVDAQGLTARGRLALGGGKRLGLDPGFARQWAAAECGDDPACERALRTVVAATLARSDDDRVPPVELERHLLNAPAAAATRENQRAAVRALYRLTVEAAVAAGHLGPDLRSRILGALETRADLPWWPSSRAVLRAEGPRRLLSGPGTVPEEDDPVLLAQAMTETANGVMDDSLPDIGLLGGTGVSLVAGGTWRDSDWQDVGYGGDLATFSVVGSRPVGERITLGIASTWEFAGMEEGGRGAGGHGATVGPFVSLTLGDGLSAHVLGTFSQFESDVRSWWDDGAGRFGGRRWGAVAGLGYGTGSGAWNWGGWAETTWFRQTRDAFTDTLGRDTPAFSLDSVQLQVGGEVAYGGDLAALSPRLDGSFRPWASANAVLTGQTPLTAGTADEGPEAVRGRLRLGLDITGDGLPALSLEGGAGGLGAEKPAYDARAGLRLRF
ncbi:hypothetical protein ACM64Y_16130 [Novispirillum sp. DQ9]|uniref:hypothetical protein n=1 Tax=Novispirillum sp. DQ9 TaxID=3398612 RepID=UPI003C7AA95B